MYHVFKKKYYSLFAFLLLLNVVLFTQTGYLSILWPKPINKKIEDAWVEGRLKLRLSYGTFWGANPYSNRTDIVKNYGVQETRPINVNSENWNEYYHRGHLAIYNPEILNHDKVIYSPKGGPAKDEIKFISDEALRKSINYLISHSPSPDERKDEAFWIIFDTTDEQGNAVLKVRDDGNNRQFYNMAPKDAAEKARRQGIGTIIWRAE